MFFSKNNAHSLITAPHAVEFLPHGFAVLQTYAMRCTPSVNSLVHLSMSMNEMHAFAPQMDAEQGFDGSQHGSLSTAGEDVVEFRLAAAVVGDDNGDAITWAPHGWRLGTTDAPPEVSVKQVVLVALFREPNRVSHGVYGPLTEISGKFDVYGNIFHEVGNNRKFNKFFSNILINMDDSAESGLFFGFPI